MAVLAAAGLLASACVHQGAAKVGVAKLEASLVFGVQDKKPSAPPSLPTGPVPDVAATAGFDVFSFDNPTTDFDNTKTTIKPACPLASVTAAPEKAVEAYITGTPPEGLVKWRRGGTVTTGSGAKASFTGFEGRVVRNYTKIDDNNFEFQTVQPRLDKPAVEISTFHVKTNGQTVENVGTNGVPTVRTQAPDAGVVLTRIDRYNEQGQVESSFAPGQGLLLLPLPVTTGEQYQSVAVDGKSGHTMQIDATVTRRQRVDACGDLVDGWEVQTQLTDSSLGQLTYNYIVATQYGGVLISEVYQAAQSASPAGPPPGVPSFADDLNFQLAQLHPSPVPAGFNP
jgi:hypothetical protein